ncbi:DEAD/DEAH box helicase [Nanoarchaeota archaeon]
MEDEKFDKDSLIQVKEKPDGEKLILNTLTPLVKQWFFSRFNSLSLPQKYAVYDIHCRQNILVSAPTGATKTLTGFLSIINELVDLSEKDLLEDRIYAVYISPLKALNYDIQHNLKTPLRELEYIAKKKLGIKVAVRTGDTTTKERASMTKNPPHILITTPESLAILLQSINFRNHLKNVEWTIIDEIHALAENKRGVHLSLSMEMLQRLSPGMCRIGLSATIAPLQDIAGFLIGKDRPCKIVDVQFIKDLDLKVISPVRNLVDTTHERMHKRMYEVIHDLIQQHKTTLVFTNTRAATERIVHYLKERFPKDYTDVITEANEDDFEKGLQTNGNGNIDVTSDRNDGNFSDDDVASDNTAVSPKTSADGNRVAANLRSAHNEHSEGHQGDGSRSPRTLSQACDFIPYGDGCRFPATLSPNGEFSGQLDNDKTREPAATAEGKVSSSASDQESKTKPSSDADKDQQPEIPNVLNEKEYQKLTAIGAHHGSLSKTHRHKIEEGLRKGNLKCVVCSTSLELGIDIGYIDLVILLGSPKSVSRALQRVGRSGHQLHSTTKGRIVVLDRDDLVECSVLLKSAIEKKIDRIHIPKNCLDVLSQQIYGICISETLHVSELHDMIKKSYCYSDLSEEDFYSVLDYLSGEHVSLEDRHVYGKIWRNPDNGMVGRKGRLARVIYMTNIGTIPDSTGITVKVGAEIIGMIDEAFLERLKRGDVFVLGGSTYQFQFSRGTVAQVLPAAGRKPTVPSWFSEMLPLSFDLANDIGRFRMLMRDKFREGMKRKDILDFIHAHLYVDDNAAAAIYEYMREQYDFAVIPTHKDIVIEHYLADDKKYAVFHTLYGRRVNDCLSRAVAFAVSKIVKRDVEVGITDNGFYIAAKKTIPAARALSMLESKRFDELLHIAIDKTQVLSRRFRHCAGRSLMILRNYKGHTKRVGKQQVSSMILMAAVKRISKDFPILKEARREVLEDLMDLESAKKVIRMIENQGISVKSIDTQIPSPFSFNLVLQGHLDMVRMEDRIDFLKRMHNLVLAKISLDQGKRGDVGEDLKKVYSEIWKSTEAEISSTGEKERLIRQAWNLKKVPMFAKKEIVRLLEGERTGIRQDVIAAMTRYKKEIEKTWPRDLRIAVESAVEEIQAEEDV